MSDLPIVQKTYDLVKWYVPIITGLYDLLEGLIVARYSQNKLVELGSLNTKLDIIRYQTRLLLDFDLIKTERYEYVQKLINEIGIDLGGWIKQQKQKVTGGWVS
jgi:hypothetical protein